MTKSAIDRFVRKKYTLWNMNRLGIKANMPDILASLLSNQIKDVYKNLKLREKAHNYYNKLLTGSGIITPDQQIIHLYITA